jgi:hypothetical protein
MIKKLNLVYDYWFENSEEPVANGIKIFGDYFWDGRFLIENYTNRGLGFGHYQEKFPKDSDRFQTVKCKLDDVKNNSNEKFYYFLDYHRFDLCKALCIGPIEHNETIQAVLDRKSSISEEVLEYLKRYDNFFIVMLTAHEPEGIKAFRCLVKFIEDNSLDPKKIFIVNNNSKLNELKHTFIPKVNVHPLKFIANTSNFTLSKINSKFNIEKQGKFFLCHNRSPKPHRYSILALLKHENILDDVNWSLVPGHTGFGKHNFRQLFNDEDMIKCENDIEYLIKFDLKKSDYEEDEHWFKRGTHELNMEGLPIWMRIPEKEATFENSYVNIVTESYYGSEDLIVHITEKSFRPFYFYQLPIFVATHHHVKHLRETYGFDIFDDIIDHSYDEVLNDRERLIKIVEEIKRLNDNKELIKEFYRNNYDRFEKNKNIIYDILKNTDDYIFFRSLI